jgi:NADPH:quinone reductase-like Zn-dependent oxidoreductase
MQTIYREGYGPAEDLRVVEAPVPVPGKGEVCIRVHATTVNRTDCGVLLGEPYIFRFFVGWPRPRHSATGTDFAGVVHTVGSGVYFVFHTLLTRPSPPFINSYSLVIR